jgi:Cu/Ag efflux pump CusA
MLSGTRANIAVKIFGEDLYQLRELAKDAEAVMTEIPGVVDLSVEQQNDIPVHRVEFDRAAIARYGLQVQDVAAALQAAFRGDAMTQILEGRNSFDLVLRVGDAENPDAWTNAHAEMVEGILVDTPSGAKIPLDALALISREVGPNMISRENARRKIVVMCNVADRALGDVVADIQRSVAEQVALPPGYYVEYGGQFESAEATRTRLGILGVIVVLGIGFLLYNVFKSHRDALLIMVNLPLALIGGVAGVYVSGGVLSVASVIGFISVFGIAARNGIMLVSHIRHLQHFEGVTDFADAVRGPPGDRGRTAGSRDSHADGHRHPVRPVVVDVPEHGRRACALPALRQARAGRGRRECPTRASGRRARSAPSAGVIGRTEPCLALRLSSL